MREGYILPFNLSDGDGITPPPSKDRGSFTPEQTHVLPPLYPRGLFKTCRLGSGTWVLSAVTSIYYDVYRDRGSYLPFP